MFQGRRVARGLGAVCALVGILGGCGGGGSAGSLHPAGKVAITAQTVTLTDVAGNPTSRTLSIPAVSAAPGQEISLPVTVNDISGIAGAVVKLGLDKTVFTCADVTPGGWVSPQAQVVKNAAAAAIAVASTVPCATSSSPAVVATFGLRVLTTSTPQNAAPKLTAVLCDAKGNTLGQVGASSAGTVHTAQTEGLIGDLMDDGQADIGSAIKIMRVVVGIDPQPPAANLWQWDCNGNGSVDVGDATKILRCVVGLDVWPIGEGSPITYEIVDLGTLPGGWSSYATAINASGQVVGFGDIPPTPTSSGFLHAFLYSGGTMTDIGTLPGGPVPSTSQANGINALGQVVGNSECGTSTDTEFGHAFLYSGGTMTDLGALPGGAYSFATSINASGQVVGASSYLNSQGAPHAFLYSGEQMTDLGILPNGGWSQANDINASGQVAGCSSHAFLYTGVPGSGGKMTDLGVLSGGSSSYADGINDSGQIVGYSDTKSRATHAFLYSGGKMIDLGTLPGWADSLACKINASGQVVGYSSPDSSWTGSHAFVYSGGKMTDLGTLPGGTYSQACGINDAGQVVGRADTSGGATHAVLWQPVVGTSAAPAGTKARSSK